MITQSLGKYRIKKWLGGGAFGDVYLAVDTIIDKEFALKVSRLRKKDIQLLKEEAKLLASLEHPNIVRFYNVDEIEGKLILIMEYVPGSSLRELIEKGKLPLDKSLSIMSQVLEALSYAHSKGAIHRDIKPENILIHKDIVKLTDFGLARFIKEGSLSASMAGTPIYMAPEVWKGKISPQSDIYSAGLVLYEMLTGRNPFIADNLEEIRKRIFSGLKDPPSRYNPSLPSEIDEAVLKATSLDPLQRYRSAEEFKNSLEGLSVSRPFIVLERRPEEADGILLTPAQEEIVKSSEQRILLAGSAGTGKTTVLIHRVAYLIKKGISPLQILVLTFTRKSANDLRERLDLLVGSEGREVTVDTFHSFGEKILRAEGEVIELKENFEVIDPFSHNIFTQLKKKFGSTRAKILLEKVEKLKTSLIEPEDKNYPWTVELQLFYREYERMKKERNLLDYSDLIMLAVKVLKHYRGEEYRKRFKYIFVDEFQDLNRAQYEMVKVLIDEDTHLFLTGDDHQSIYGWRGAKREYMRLALNEIEKMQKLTLTASFRLPEKHILVARNLMRKASRGAEIADLPSTSMVETQGKVEFYKASSVEDEADFVVRKIKEGVKKGRAFSDFAILIRVTHYSRIFEERLSLHSIPFSFVGMRSFYQMEEVRAMVDILDAISKREASIISSILNWMVKSRNAKFSHEGDRLTVKLKEGFTKVPPRMKTLCDFVNGVIENPQEWAPKDIIEGIVESSGFLKRKMNVREVQKKENVQELLVSAQRFGKGETEKFIQYVKLMEDLEVVDWKKNSVKLLTVHASKGLEFKVVFVVGLIEDIFPVVRSLRSVEEMEEERRLLYVAITRATEELYLSFPAYYQRKPAKPSRYLLDMAGM